jgi:hypothetical protein
MRDEQLGYADDLEEPRGVAAVAALAAFCGLTLALAILLFALVGWRLPL